MLLANLRENARSAGTIILFGIIIVVFIFSFGPASNGCRSGALKPGSDSAAKVNGEKISRKQFEQAYAQHLSEFQRRSGGQESLTREQADALGFGGQVLDQLIDRELLFQAAKKEGLRISDDEVANELNKIEAFKVNGVFDKDAYASVVQRSLGLQVWQFEDELRRDLLIQKKAAAIQDSIRVSDEEIVFEYRQEKEVYALSVVRFLIKNQESAIDVPTQEAIDAFAKEHTAEVAARYEENKSRYNVSKQVQARHILIKTTDGTSVEDATAKILAIKERIVSGKEDFAEVAKVESQDEGSKVKGGDLGIFGEGRMVAEFQAAAFALKDGELSDPVVTQFGVHLIKVEKVVPAKSISLEEATPEIAQALLKESLMKAKATEQAQATLNALKEGKSLADQWPEVEPGDSDEANGALLGKPRVETTGDFKIYGSFIPSVGISEGLAADLPNLKVGPADKIYETNEARLVVNVDKHDIPDMSALTDEVKETYRAKMKLSRSSEALSSFLASAKKTAKIIKDPSIGGMDIEAIVSGKK